MQQLGIIMPTAVMMEENFDKLLEQCEAQELEVSAERRHPSKCVCEKSAACVLSVFPRLEGLGLCF